MPIDPTINPEHVFRSVANSDLDLSKRFEKIKTHIYNNSVLASKAVAQEIAHTIKSKQLLNQPCVLGLATGSSPKYVYKELVSLFKAGELSFKNVYTFNLDEYYPMEPDSLNSYVRFMEEQLFNHIDIPRQNCFIPDGRIGANEITQYCREYEAKIESLGGIDFQLLGIGGNGHIGFNEPGTLLNTRTRLVALDHSTRAAASWDFNGMQNVPRKALSVGISTILKAKRIVLLAWGEKKTAIIKEAVEGKISEHVPASYLQYHENTTFVIDESAANQLTRVQTPWLVDRVDWDMVLTKKAVCHLALKLSKPILKLTEQDYQDNGLGDLLVEKGSAYDLNILIFNELQRTITGWPGGKPNADDNTRPERAEPAQKRCLIFSPHPDDDIISMGGTFIRLHEQGHDVHVAYQTSGNIAVSDDEAIRFADFVVDYNDSLGFANEEAKKIYEKASTFVRKKKPSEKDFAALRTLKGIIRKGEAKATCRFVGIPAENAHFMNLPFYETGEVQKKPLGKIDIDMTVDLIRSLKPHQIFAAGDLADPHGTHKVCLDAVFAAIDILKNEDWMKDCWVWLYRGAWAEWDIQEIEMAVPLSPNQVLQKRHGIWKHQSQKDGVVFQGSDSREFWQCAEERNAATAQLYNRLGLSEYAAIEAFVRYHF